MDEGFPIEQAPGLPKSSAGASWFQSNLIALSSAAVVTIYAAGYARTKPAADRIEAMANEREAHVRTRMASVDAATLRAVQAVAAQPVLQAPNAKPQAASEKPQPPKQPPSAPRGSQALAATSVDTKAADSTKRVADSVSAAEEKARAVAAAAAADAVRADSVAKAEANRPHYKDGTFTGWGTSRHGDLLVEIDVKEGKITSVWISQCLTNYSCAMIEDLPPQVIARQSPDVDTISRATQSSNAFYYAVVEALKKAK